MSDAPKSDVHSELVSTWEEKSANGLSLVEHIRLLERGILSVERRASQTLSRVTLLVILDRVLQQSKNKFPILSQVSIEPSSLHFEIDSNLDVQKHGQLIEALRFLLIELLNVLGRITSDILTIPLHVELLKVTWNEPEKK